MCSQSTPGSDGIRRPPQAGTLPLYTGRPPRACGGIGRRARLRALSCVNGVGVRVSLGAFSNMPHATSGANGGFRGQHPKARQGLSPPVPIDASGPREGRRAGPILLGSATRGTVATRSDVLGYGGDGARPPQPGIGRDSDLTICPRTPTEVHDVCSRPRFAEAVQENSFPRARARRASRSSNTSLLVRYHQAGDLEAREELVQRFLPFARELARRYAYADEPFDDLLQVASLGLAQGARPLRPGSRREVHELAAPTILGELKRYFRDKGWALHVSRDLQERSLAVSREAEQLAKQLGRSPKPRDVAQVLGWPVRGARGATGPRELRGERRSTPQRQGRR